MSKFANLIAGLAVVRDERARVGAKLEAARRELEEINALPMCKSDVIAKLDEYVDGCKAMFRENLQHVLGLHNRAGRETFDNIGQGLPLLRTFSGTIDDRVICAVLAPQLKAAIRDAMEHIPCAGSSPLAKRRARRAELEATIASLKEQLAEIQAAADQARNSL